MTESDENLYHDEQVVTLPEAEVTMTQTIRLCIQNKPELKTIDDGYLKPRQCERLIKLLIEGDPIKCLPLWSELRPEYLVEEGRLVFRNESIKNRGPIGFRNEIEVYGFPVSLVDEACEIHKYLNRIIRKKDNRKELFFFCLYHASHNLRMPIFPEEIAARLGLTSTGMSRALNSINPLHYGVAITNFYPSPQYYVPRILEDMELEPGIADIVSISINNMIKEDPTITNYYKPQRIAMAVVLNFIEENGIVLPNDFDHILLRGNQRELRDLRETMIQYDYL